MPCFSNKDIAELTQEDILLLSAETIKILQKRKHYLTVLNDDLSKHIDEKNLI